MRLVHHEKLLWPDAFGSARWAGSHAGRPTREILAHIAFDRELGTISGCCAVLARPGAAAEQQPAQQTGFAWRSRRQLDDAVGAVVRAVTASNARVSDEHLAVRRAPNSVRRAVRHAVRMLAGAA